MLIYFKILLFEFRLRILCGFGFLPGWYDWDFFTFCCYFAFKYKGKGFFRATVYLPEVISPIAIGYAWLLYVFNSQIWSVSSFFLCIGLDSLANIQWTNPENIFYAMAIAAIFGAVGQFTLMYLSAMEKIPKDYYEVARIEGQGAVQQFFNITLPLISSVLKSSLVLFTTATIGFFAFSQVFSGISTITPMVFTYDQIFGTEINPETNVGVGAALVL